jgi:hypothetical protein
LQLLKGEILLAPAVRSAVLHQIMEWNPLKISNTDDIIDPIGYVDEIMQEYPELIVKNIFDVDSEPVDAAHASTLALPF